MLSAHARDKARRMSAKLNELVKLLELERLEHNLFRGQSQDLGWGVVFGGQVLGQALSAAVQTVPRDRPAHSLHAQFLRPGDVSKPIIYDVDRIRDGSSFTTRRVVAIQNGHAIFHLSASFQAEESGFSHQDEMGVVPGPETVPSEQQRLAKYRDVMPEMLHGMITAERPFDVRPLDTAEDPIRHAPQPAQRRVWFKTVDKLPDTPALHQFLLAYISDSWFVTTALLPHGVTWLTPGMQVASLDHAMWFHQPLRVDDWLLHVMDSPAAHGARGLARGRIFTRDGRLVASTAQEGLIRRHQVNTP